MGHLEDPTLTSDLTVARDFDLGMTGPPLSISMDFIAGGLVEMIGGLASRRRARRRTRGGRRSLLGGAWLATHWLLRESAVWRDRNTDEVRGAQRDADYAYRLAVDPPASKELRLFGLAGWTIDRFVARRTRLHALQYEATRLRERPVALEPAARRRRQRRRVLVARERRRRAAASSLGEVVDVRAERRRHVDDRVRRAQLGARRRGGAGRRRAAPRAGDGARRRAAVRRRVRPPALPAREIRFRDRHLRVPGRRARARALRPHDSRRLVARHRRTERRRQDDARQAALPAVRPAVGRDRGRRRRPARASTSARGARASPPCSRTSSASSCRCATTSRRPARPTTSCAPRSRRPARRPSPASTPCWPAATTGGTDLSGGQWQRVALARALCAVQLGAGVVLLDEPTAQLDVRGEAEIFDRILAATRHCTTILISHRFSTVRHADRICVLEHGRVDRARHARRADGARRPLPDDVRPAGAALHRRRGRGGDDL